MGLGRRGSTTSTSLLGFVRSNRFVKDLGYASSNLSHAAATANVWVLLEIIRKKEPIPPEYQTHPMKGAWNGWNDSHIANDLVLIWRYETRKEPTGDREIVVLGALGTHAYLGIA